jgi:hypothetical protein
VARTRSEVMTVTKSSELGPAFGFAYLVSRSVCEPDYLKNEEFW